MEKLYSTMENIQAFVYMFYEKLFKSSKTHCFTPIKLQIGHFDHWQFYLVALKQWFLTFLKSGNTFDYMKNLRNAKWSKKTNKNIPRRNKYILENILLNIFKFYILKYIIKSLQSHDNDKEKNSAFIISRNTCKNSAFL